MHSEPRSKSSRQQLIVGIVARRRVSTQFELMDALSASGCRVTQATISRDIRQLGLEKIHDELGRPRYALPTRDGRRRQSASEALASVLAQFGRTAVAAQNLVVVQTETGAAPALARALDRTGREDVVGTVAGDDTVLVVTRDARGARSLARELAAAVR